MFTSFILNVLTIFTGSIIAGVVLAITAIAFLCTTKILRALLFSEHSIKNIELSQEEFDKVMKQIDRKKDD